MIRIMLVDDEPIFISDLKNTINNIGNGYKVIYEAYDAQDAMANIKIQKPDIIFTDIKMPGINGISLVKEIKKQYTHIIPIIISGYQDFELVREALRANVDDYLIKPVDEEQLRNILENKSNKIRLLRHNLQLDLLNHSMNHEAMSMNDVITYFSEYSYYILMLISPSLFLPENKLQEIRSILKKNESCWLLDPSSEDNSLILFGLNHSDINTIVSIAEQLNNKSYINQNIYSILLSFVFYDIRKLHCTVKKMKDEKDIYQILGRSLSVFENKGMIDNIDLYNRLQETFRENLQNALWSHNWHNFCEVINKAFEFCQKEKIPKILIKKFLFRITIAVEKNYSIKPEYTELNIENNIENIIELSEDYNELTNKYIDFLMKICPVNDENNIIRDDELMILIENYLKENFTKKINVDSVCKYFYISQSKMNRIFKKYKKISFIEYLTILKIDEAKKIIKQQPNISMNHLSTMLGFNDNLYFSKVFKKTTSLSPTEYKKQNT